MTYEWRFAERFGVWAGVNVGIATLEQQRARNRRDREDRPRPRAHKTLAPAEAEWLEERYG